MNDLIPISGNILPVDETYTIMVIQFGDEYECYGKRRNSLGTTPFMYMFGCSCENTTFQEAVSLAIDNVPLYDDIFEGGE